MRVHQKNIWIYTKLNLIVGEGRRGEDREMDGPWQASQPGGLAALFSGTFVGPWYHIPDQGETMSNHVLYYAR